MSEKVFVENVDQSDPFNYGIISYKIIADYVFSDLAISGALGIVRILIDIEKPFFFIHAELNVVESPIHFSDITSVTLEDGNIHVVIDDENYAPEVLKILWTRFGRENISQTDRWNLYVPQDYISVEELNQLVAINPRDRIMNKILDAMNRIIPEAFRVKQVKQKSGLLTIIASENPIEDEWIQLAQDFIASRSPIRIPEEYLRKVGRAPKKIKKKVVPWKTHEFQESIK